MARFATELGIGTVPPADPNTKVTAPRAGALASLMASSFVERSFPASIEVPTQCLLSENHGQCVGCCKAAIGEIPDEFGNLSAGKVCSRFCKTNVPPGPSDSEPES